MLDFSDAPYQFFPANPDPVVRWIGSELNFTLILRGPNHRLRSINLQGASAEVKQLAKEGKRLVFVANHSTHSDPQLMTEVHRQLKAKSCFMAAYDVFLRSRFNRWLMPRLGCFSIDREGSDRKAMKQAADILAKGDFGLTIFPEGNVYLTNDRVTPFLEGAAFLSLKSQKDLGDENPIYIVPAGFKFTYITDVRDVISEHLDKVAKAVDTEFDRSANAVEELHRIGRTVLVKNLRQRGFLSRDEAVEDEHFTELLHTGAQRILAGLKEKIDVDIKEDASLIEQVRKIRSAIHQIRSAPEKEVEHRVAATWADEAILAFRIISYATPYVVENPTVDRYAETVEKLCEDLFGKPLRPFGPRRAEIVIREPINLVTFMKDHPGKLRNAVNALNELMESEVQTGIDDANLRNETIGSEPF